MAGKTLAEMIAERKAAQAAQATQTDIQASGQRADQEQAPPQTKSKPTFKLDISKFKGLTSKASAKPAKQDILHGTGITKKLIVSQERAALKIPQTPKELADDARRIVENIAVSASSDPGIPALSLPVKSDIVLDDSQIAALEGLRRNKYAVLIGAAGTGKTTVTKKLCEELEASTGLIDLRMTRPQGIESAPVPEMNVAIGFCSFTGRAVQQLKRALPKEYHPLCQTIHATLGYMPEYEEVAYINDRGETDYKNVLRFYPTFDASRKLPYKIIIIDEAGMCPIKLFNELVEATTDDCRFILIGDINQLPPVQGRSVLGFAMSKWPTFALEKIHRQAENNPIIANAHRVLTGVFPTKAPQAFDIVSMPGGSIETYNKLIAAVQMLHKAGQFDPNTDAIIVPQNDGQLGQRTINEKLVHYFNPPMKQDGVVINRRHIIQAGYSTPIFAVGDKVMLLQNDRERGLTNGMTGLITELTENGHFDGKRADIDKSFDAANFKLEVDMADFMADVEASKEERLAEKGENQRQASHITTVRFHNGVEDVEVKFQTAGDYRRLTHAYAFTCHKSQGGEYPTVIILCHSATIRMLSREWLYTAVTRARNRVVLCCNDRGLAHALNTQRVKGKNIKEKCEVYLKLMLAESKGEDIDVPMLAEPELMDSKKEAAE